MLLAVGFACTLAACDINDAGLVGLTVRDGGARRDGQGLPDPGPGGAGGSGGVLDAGMAVQTDGAPAEGELAPDGPVAPDAADAPGAPPMTGPTPPRPVLLLVGDQDLSPGDEIVLRRLQFLGFRVQAREVEDEDDASDALQAARSVDLVVISSSLPAGTGVARQTGMLPVPILCSNNVFLDDLGISAENEEGESNPEETQLRILAPAHPLAGGRRGLVRVVRAPGVFRSAEVLAGTIPIAAIAGDDEQVSIVGLEKDASTPFGAAPARRVGWFAQEDTFTALNSDGWSLFDAAVKWLVPAP
jgi:hypothetical protein